MKEYCLSKHRPCASNTSQDSATPILLPMFDAMDKVRNNP